MRVMEDFGAKMAPELRQAMLKMKKIDSAALTAAFRGEQGAHPIGTVP